MIRFGFPWDGAIRFPEDRLVAEKIATFLFISDGAQLPQEERLVNSRQFTAVR
jgi:hypothetical protein